MKLPPWYIAAVLLTQSIEIMAASTYLGSEVFMQWTFTTTNITITLKANTTGWLGIGFSPNGGMVGSDIAIITALNGNVTILDCHAVKTALPLVDTQQNYQLLNGSSSNGQLSVTFTRALDTCDLNDTVITPYTMNVIHAYGSLDATGVPQYHGANRGSHSLYLLTTEPPPANDSGIFYIDPVPPKIAISNASQTTYWCSIMQLPNITSKSHIIEMQPVVVPGNEDIVHHMLLYSCTSVNLNFTSFDCLVNGKDGGNQATCTALVGIWGTGGTAYRFPLNVGLPIGGSSTTQYVMLQTHYSNLNLATGRTDASYIRFLATPNLRQHDAGILQTGVVPGIFIPPNVNQMLVSGYCTSDCLSTSNLPAGGITMFAVVLHSHLLGRRITLRQFRPYQNTELPVISDDPYYNFNYQELKNLDTPRQIIPGDLLQTVCTMSSTSRSVVTQGGLGTMQEMCLSFILYYPKMSITDCQSYPPFTFVESDKVYTLLGKPQSSFDWFQYTNDGLSGATWSTALTQAIQTEYFNGMHLGICQTNAQTNQRLYLLPAMVSSSLPDYTTTGSCTQPASSAATVQGGAGMTATYISILLFASVLAGIPL